MTRIIHRTKIYTKEYYLSCLIFGLMTGWAESLIIWMFLPFSVETGELMLFNLIAAALGGATCLIAALLTRLIHLLLWKHKKFNR